MKIAVTGHRPNKLKGYWKPNSNCVSSIENEMIKVLEFYNPSKLISGMALGIDTIWAELSIKKGIDLIAAIPCKGQHVKWSNDCIDVYHKILDSNLTQKYYVSEKGYDNKCMNIRNEWMVDECDLLLSFWDGSSGGTSNCVRYARKVNVPTLILDPNNLGEINFIKVVPNFSIFE